MRELKEVSTIAAIDHPCPFWMNEWFATFSARDDRQSSERVRKREKGKRKCGFGSVRFESNRSRIIKTLDGFNVK
ncbi:hypothetical protein M747DRAFT_295849 [Aspergillus niger ATCC 13496]|uniref:Uncharacterized protein n=1 Tax=Aspergillus niger ATCC 13496 TaxID=1353008 RepID=A0A370BXP1_ASPNG|nr:hypothetical protein M747DRAFT_295849 [Aspergillus niger ATCC 13496]